MFSFSEESLRRASSGVLRMKQDSIEHSLHMYPFQTFKAENSSIRIAAIDGSHHNKRGNHFVFSALRAGYHLYQNGKCVDSKIEPITIELLMRNNDPELGFLSVHERYFFGVTGEQSNEKMEYEKATERIRTLMEWRYIRDLCHTLKRGDMILFDGSLLSGEISTSHEYVATLANVARERGVILCGLSKDSGLTIGTATVSSVLRRASKTQSKGVNWLCKVDDSYFVRFSQTRDLIYRLDAVLPDGVEPLDVASAIGAYCHSKLCPSYPFPLQKIHDSVRISELELETAFSRFMTISEREYGVTRSEIESLFSIYHDELDIISRGR